MTNATAQDFLCNEHMFSDWNRYEWPVGPSAIPFAHPSPFPPVPPFIDSLHFVHPSINPSNYSSTTHTSVRPSVDQINRGRSVGQSINKSINSSIHDSSINQFIHPISQSINLFLVYDPPSLHPDHHVISPSILHAFPIAHMVTLCICVSDSVSLPFFLPFVRPRDRIILCTFVEGISHAVVDARGSIVGSLDDL